MKIREPKRIRDILNIVDQPTSFAKYARGNEERKKKTFFKLLIISNEEKVLEQNCNFLSNSYKSNKLLKFDFIRYESGVRES